jgi:CubicO group peptidase (beta-lactamase class C family)
MKNQLIIKLFAFIALALTLINPFAASGKDLGDLPDNKQFDVDKFETYLRSKLDGNAVGYTFVIYQNGKYLRSGNYGYAVLKKDDPNILDIGDPLRPETRMNIASVTKTITATAVLKAIQDKMVDGYPNLTINSPINNFLPPNWTRGPGVATLTFKELMSQYSGMFDNGGFTDIKSLRAWIKSGVTRPKTAYKYINGNLAIFRIILPYMLASEETRKAWNYQAQFDDNSLNSAVSVRYKQLVRDLVLTPSELKNIDMKYGSYAPTRWYNQANNANGYADTDWTLTGGGGGWVMSAYELAQFMAHLRYDDKLLKPVTRKSMDDNMLGWEDPAAWKQFQGKYGNYLGHGGGLSYGKPETLVGMNSVIINYPSGIQGVLLINSLGNYPHKAQLMRDAFDAAVVLKPILTK